MERPISWYEQNWRELELANDRSPASGRAWKGLKVERDGREPTPKEWAALARYTRLRNAEVDHRTAIQQITGRDPGPDVDRLFDRLVREGLLLVDGKAVMR